MFLDLLHYFETTLLILILTFIFLLLSTLFFFESAGFWHKKQLVKLQNISFLELKFPIVLIAPLLIIATYRILHISLFFPLASDLSLFGRLEYLFVPSLLLLFASGLFFRTRSLIIQNYTIWLNKPCARFSASLGVSAHSKFRRLMVQQSILQSLQECLPWLFCEIIIVEIIFNMPGIGLDLWNSAKARDIYSFFLSLGILLAVFFIVLLMNASFSKKLGDKLEGYL
ncbi:MAG: hypothetical protein KBD78_12575 [Oligoflexales bacterium]|nr:hypothetical protein [Oligoflexales bacterium]